MMYLIMNSKSYIYLNLTPLPYKGRGWGLGLYWTQLRTAIALNQYPPRTNSQRIFQRREIGA